MHDASTRRYRWGGSMEFLVKSKFNSIQWITSLKPFERGATVRVLEDLQTVCAGRGLPLEVHYPKTADAFLALLHRMAEDADAGMTPLLHLDMHGSKDGGLAIEATGESITWLILADALRQINAASRNNLCVFSGACFSFHAVSQIDITKAAAFYILVAPEHDITGGALEENTLGLYRDILSGVDIIAAVADRFGDRMRYFHCEEMFANILYAYLDEKAVGKNKRARIEDRVTKAVEWGAHTDSAALSKLRRLAAALVEPTEDLIDRHGGEFLAGRKPGFTVRQLVEEALRNRHSR